MGMDSRKLSARKKQPGHDRTFEASERNFAEALRQVLDLDQFVIVEKPRDLDAIIPKADGNGAYGVIPEVSVTSRKTGKKLFFEVKKQGPRGNADERACKHHTVQFYRTLKELLGYNYHPFFTVFCEDLATDVRYVSKHPFFYEAGQFFSWVGYDLESLEKFVKELCEKHLA